MIHLDSWSSLSPTGVRCRVGDVCDEVHPSSRKHGVLAHHPLCLSQSLTILGVEIPNPHPTLT